MSDVSRGDMRLIRLAVSGDRGAAHALVRRLAPTVQHCVVRLLLSSGAVGARLRQELEDLTQEVFAALFSNAGRDLLRWDPLRGMKLESFVSLLAHRHTISVLRSRRQSPLQAAGMESLQDGEAPEPSIEDIVEAREDLERVARQLHEQLSPLGLEMFYRSFVWGQSVEVICRETSSSADSVYQWRARLKNVVRAIAESSAANQDASHAIGEP